MEKFAVDLDKVLDEFEFNEDRAEQTAALPTNHAVSLIAKSTTQCTSSTQCTTRNHSTIESGTTANTGLDVAALPLEEYKISQQVNLTSRTLPAENDGRSDDLNVRKRELPLENTDSANHFYTHNLDTDNKVQQKQCIEPPDSEPVSLTIHNDISQKLLQKRQNENSSTKIQNSYDKKLNQPNVKPSVSNVFNSLNEYINAPSVSLDYVDNTISRQDSNDSKQEELASVTEVSMKNATIKERNVSKNSIVDHKVHIKSDESGDVNGDIKKLSNAVLPKYQNILLPVKLESFITDKTSGTGEEQTVENLSLPGSITEENKEPVYTNVVLPEVTERSKESKSLIDRPEHVYENVYIGTDIPKTQEIYATVNKTKPKDKESKGQDEAKHTYENVEFGESNKTVQTNDKDVYECIYIGNRENLPETTTELEVAAKKISDQLYVNETNAEPEIKSINTAKLVFQTVHLGIPQENKLVGFSHIDDLSEEELNKYLAELESEERAREGSAFYENTSVSGTLRDATDNFTQNKFQNLHDDEDANEAPIFESVTIGELPKVSEEQLLEKAKKFPVIDYSKSGPSGETMGDFLAKKGLEKFHEPIKAISEVKEDKGKGKKSKKTDEKMKKISDSIDSNVDSSLQDDSVKVVEISEPDAKSKESENYISEAIKTISEVQDYELPKEKDESENEDVQNIETHVPASDIDQSQDILQSNEAKVSVESNNDESSSNCAEKKSECSENVSTIEIIRSNGEQSANDEVTIKDDKVNFVESIHTSNSVDASTSDLSKNAESCLENNTDIENDEEDLEKPSRPRTLNIVSSVNMDEQSTVGSPGTTPGIQEQAEIEEDTDHGRGPSPDASENSSMESGTILGKQPPFWIPDGDAPNCMLCDVKFTMIKRRHHCRACGKVLCSKCCGMKYRLEYQGNIDSRVCPPCYQLLVKVENENGAGDWSSVYTNNASSSINSPHGRQPNPNNPMEYCSTIPPLQQLAGGLPPPPMVMVPVGVLKREGSAKQRPEKSVMFSDGIRPGCDLTELDSSWDQKPPYRKPGTKRLPTPPGPLAATTITKRQNLPPLDPYTNSYIPQDSDVLPPTVTIHKGQISFHEVLDRTQLYESLKNECEPPVLFAINRNLYAYVKITNLTCCVNKVCWNVTSRGLACVGQDEVIFLVETLPDETQIPKDLLVHINQIYVDAIKGSTVTELGVTIHQGGNLLGSREHAGFLFIRQTFQCLQRIVLPPAPFLVGLLVHRWETPWAKVFPLRLVLRLGAEYRYYPCPLVSVRFRDAVYFEIGHTIMKLLADFRNFAYTLPTVRGLTIHMQDRTTDVMFPKNRYDQVIRGLNNSNDHVLAYASNFSVSADSHLVCIQTNTGDESTYQTQAINIHNKPRKVTGASFVVINGALKSSMGLSARSSILEDGLMVQIMPEKMEALKAALKNMQDFSIGCGRQGAPEPDETVNIKWVENDVQFNLGVKSPIDGKAMDGVPSIRVHNGSDYMGTSRFIRWTEVFIIKSDDHPHGVHDPVDINKLSESIARATCAALVKLLDLLATAGLTKLAVRTTIHPDNVGYEAGSEGTRLPPIYMKSLDNELIQVLHKSAQSSQDTYTVLELIFHVLDD